ncbi:MAG: hypothetical protein M3081_19735 [Gemmatimonadota bacterium]|nr:hypothetical protein [Gemmatimonadota bacterium]
MTISRRVFSHGVFALALLATAACNGLAGLGGGSPQQGEVSGRIRRVDQRGQMIELQQPDGQTVALTYDNRTQVVYQNQSYGVQSLENGDEVTARIQSDNNRGYYADLIQVNRSVSSGGNGGNGGRGNGRGNGGNNGGGYGSENVQSFQGTVRQIDRNNGVFIIDAGNGSAIQVSLPYNVKRADSDRFQSLRSGDVVRLYGVFLNNSRVELRQFY